MERDGREHGRRGWVQAAMAWCFGPQQDQQRWYQSVWQAGERDGQRGDDPTQRQAAMLAQARAAEPLRSPVPLVATPLTSPQLAESERRYAARLAMIQDAMLAEQVRRQQGR
jgi:hypothetical protein